LAISRRLDLEPLGIRSILGGFYRSSMPPFRERCLLPDSKTAERMHDSRGRTQVAAKCRAFLFSFAQVSVLLFWFHCNFVIIGNIVYSGMFQDSKIRQ